MPGRLQKLTRTTKPVRQPRVEFFDVSCLCGRTISGQRLTRPQAVECPDCGEGLFVLPIDAYPPVSLTAVRRRRAAASSGLVSGSNRWRFAASAMGLASGRVLLLAILATMTVSLSVAFWVDAQTRRTARSSADSASVGSTRTGDPLSRTAAPRDRPGRGAAGRVLSGRVRNGAVVTDAAIDLPDGTRVSIRVVPAD